MYGIREWVKTHGDCPIESQLIFSKSLEDSLHVYTPTTTPPAFQLPDCISWVINMTDGHIHRAYRFPQVSTPRVPEVLSCRTSSRGSLPHPGSIALETAKPPTFPPICNTKKDKQNNHERRSIVKGIAHSYFPILFRSRGKNRWFAPRRVSLPNLNRQKLKSNIPKKNKNIQNDKSIRKPNK